MRTSATKKFNDLIANMVEEKVKDERIAYKKRIKDEYTVKIEKYEQEIHSLNGQVKAYSKRVADMRNAHNIREAMLEKAITETRKDFILYKTKYTDLMGVKFSHMNEGLCIDFLLKKGYEVGKIFKK